jgi:membrane protease YdiL (CAAX protease family)
MVSSPPTLCVFRGIQQSTIKLITGIVIAWVLGALLEELTFRGIVLKTVETQISTLLPMPIAALVLICVAAAGANHRPVSGSRSRIHDHSSSQLSLLYCSSLEQTLYGP